MFNSGIAKLIPVLLAGVAAAAVTGCQQIDPVNVYQASVSFGSACEKTYENEGGTGRIPGQGMSQEWEEIQAEDAQISGGLTIGPCRTKWDAQHIEAEAIGRKAVVLQRTGDSVKFRPATASADSIVVRYSVPDSPGGGGADYTLGLYRDGHKITSLTLSSKHSWNYLGEKMDDPATDVPGPQPHTFFDEVRFIDPHPHDGADWELRREGSDTAAFYVIDLADFEKVAPPGRMPDGFTNVETLGIHPNDGIDHAVDIEAALVHASLQNPQLPPPKLWFPPGEYIVESFGLGSNEGLDCKSCEVRGAGMWHTKFVGRRAMFFCLGRLADANGADDHSTNCHFSDFSITGTSTQRNERIAGPQKGFAGPMGTTARGPGQPLGPGSTITRVWIEHVVAGIWVGNDPPNQRFATEGLTIDDCRVRNVYADGINLANGTSHTTVRNTHIRNSGDDGIALWSVQWTKWVRDTAVSKGADFIVANARDAPDQGQESGNLIENVSVQMPWRAGCFSVYGGEGHTFRNLTCEDVLTYPGILVDNEFSSYAFGPAVTTFRNITLKRAGGAMFYENSGFPWVHGALKFYKKEGDVSNILVDGVNIISPTYAGIEFRGFGDPFVQNGEKYSPELLSNANGARFSNITLQNVTVSDPGTESIDILQNGPVGSVNLGPGINIQAPYIRDPSPTPQGWAGFFQGTAYPWTSQTSNPILDWQQRFCDTLSAQAATCGWPASEGGQDPATNCAAFASLYNAPFMNAVASCEVATSCNGPAESSPCVRAALAAAPLSPAQTGLAQDYCGRCASNDGQTAGACTAGFWHDASATGPGGPGSLEYGVSDAVVARIDAVCVGAGNCGADFRACAAKVIEAGMPASSGTCLSKRDFGSSINLGVFHLESGEFLMMMRALRQAVGSRFRGDVLRTASSTRLLHMTLISKSGNSVTLWFSSNNLYLLGFSNGDGQPFRFNDALVAGPVDLTFGGSYTRLERAAHIGREQITLSSQAFSDAIDRLSRTRDPRDNARAQAEALILMVTFTSEAARFWDIQALVQAALAGQNGRLSTELLEYETHWEDVSYYALQVTNNSATLPLEVGQHGGTLSYWAQVAARLAVMLWLPNGPKHDEL